MTSALVQDDLVRISDLLAAAAEDIAPHGGLPDVALVGIAELVGCDAASFVDMDPTISTTYLDQAYEGEQVRLEEVTGSGNDPFWQHYWDSAACSYPTRTGDDRTVTLLSDFYSQREWRATPMYVEYFAPYDVRYEIMCCLPTRGTRSRRLLLSRGDGPDFDERDRIVLSLLRPHLAELHARQAVTRAPTLTARQTELLRLVAAGRSTAQISEQLFLSQGTVRKHLENIFDRLGVTNRTAAVLRAFGENAPAV